MIAAAMKGGMERLRRRQGPAVLPWREAPPWGDVPAALEAALRRWRAYEAADVDMAVTPLDDMLQDTADGRQHYRNVGLSALRLATEAALLGGIRDPRRILDMPCGGGRVTRHLVRFYPDAEVTVADLDRPKVDAVTRQFGLASVKTSRDFSSPIPGRYDLIFVGSLVTHFDAALYRRCFHRLVDALEPGGVLILTTTGRNWAAEALRLDRADGHAPRRPWSGVLAALGRRRDRSSARLAALLGPYRRSGFGYVEVRGWTELYGQSYGGSFASPSWLMRLVEERTDAAVLAFKERGFDNLLDALLVQRVPAAIPG